jgi:glycosyltransferase involved in cell wall biosynthesis
MEQNQTLARVELAQAESKQPKGRGVRIVESTRQSFLTPISVIIPAHNEEDYLGETLDALNRQDYPDYEIVVVANGCTDRTGDAAHGKCHRLMTLPHKNLGVARNLGARMAKGELLVFLDADTILEPGALRIIAEQFNERDAGGTLKGRPDIDRFGYRLIYWLKNFIHRFVVHNGSSGVILCWKKQFTHAGGFDERLELRENSELIRRLKRFGRYRFISTSTATTSMRRYERRGVKHIVWLWIRLWFFSLFGDLRNRKYEAVR